MSFLDNLENSLKSLENSTGQEDAGRENDRRKLETAAQLAVAPWSEKLRKSPYTEEMLKIASREGFKLKTKVYITWLGSVLRLEAREKRLDMRPAKDGINAVFLFAGEETGSRLLDLEGDPAALITEWLG